MKVFSYFPNFTSRFFRIRFCLVSAMKYFLSALSGGEKCVSCGKKAFVVPFCASCIKRFLSRIKLGFKKCKICGKPLVSEIGLCSDCKKNPVLKSTDGVYPLISYRMWKKKLLFSWKMQGKRSLSSFFAMLIKEKIVDLEYENCCSLPVVPVPPRPGKIREKGWDQIDEICTFLNKGWKIEILKILKRNSKTQQKKLDRVQRLEGIGTAYSLVPNSKLLKTKIPRKVVLVDDVSTTGSTIENCAALLKKAGVEKVFVITLFMVD